ncbi:MAG: WD40 repeat domain-containing serine/threonine-protein kinase [Cyanobacteria bacterium P01_H01_bin.105]
MNHALCDGQDRYEVVKRLGQGHSGQTFLARTARPDATSKLVVIKEVYRPQESLDNLTKRLSALGEHPQLPALIDSWQSSKRQFLVFEHIKQPALSETEPPPWLPEKIEGWLLSLLAVLEYLHSFRLVHGDIRPANIRLSNRPAQTPILVDLRITPRLGKQQPALDTIEGDAAYAAPEQALGKLVYASDLYSLGLVAIHLLTGLSPFDLYSVVDNRWIWPDLVIESLPRNLSSVLHRLLERSLKYRYANARQAIIDLKKSSAPSLLDKARSLLISPDSLSQPLQTLTKKALSPAASELIKSEVKPTSQLHWDFLCQLTPGITTALALQGKILAMGTSTGAILICDLTSGAEIYSLRGRRHGDRITALAFHPRGRTLYSASRDSTVKQWDLAKGTLAHTFSQPGWQPTDVAVAPSYLIVSDGTGHITLWDLEQLIPCHKFNQHQDWVSAIATNGERLASISRDLTLRLWSLPEKQLIETFPIRQGQTLALHPGGYHIIVGNGRQVDVWEVGQSTPERLCSGAEGITALALSPDARLLAVGTDGNVLRVYEGASGQCVSELAQGWGVVAIAFNGHTLVSSSQDETVTVWQRSVDAMP